MKHVYDESIHSAITSEEKIVSKMINVEVSHNEEHLIINENYKYNYFSLPSRLESFFSESYDLDKERYYLENKGF